MTTAYAPPVTPPAPFPLPRHRADLLIAVDPALAVDPGQCDWCAEVDALATVRLTGHPDPAIDFPLTEIEVCPRCAPAAIEQAVTELDPRARFPRVTVEIAA